MNKIRKKWGRRAAGCLLGGLMAAGMVFPAAADTVTVRADRLNYRTGPSMDSTVLGTLPGGTRVEREENQGEWSRIRVSGKVCYASSAYLVPASGETDDGVQVPAESPHADRTWNVGMESGYTYASFSKISSGKAVFYHNGTERRNGKVVCVNAGHGTSGGSSVKTLCHPDGSPKVTGGTTGAGATYAAAVSSGMTFSDGTPESTVTLAMAKVLRDRLLEAGYDVLMIREENDVQLDNIARTVLANNNADCHIALHWDSTASDKGCFYMSVPGNSTYRAMEPVASYWQSHHQLGDSLIAGLREAGNRIFSSGAMEMDLTQTSYSTVPSVDIELGDKASGHSDADLEKLADGLLLGINDFFGF